MTVSAARKAEIAERDTRIATAYLAGDTTKVIAAREGISLPLVSLTLHRTGTRLPREERLARWHQSGQTPDARRKAAKSNEKNLQERFFSKVADYTNPEKCWEWAASLSGSGRPQLLWNGKLSQATHIALQLDGRPRQDGLFALHTCDNPGCVNPQHLWWGTQRDNIHDAMKKGRMNTDGLALGLPARMARFVPHMEMRLAHKPGRVEVYL